MSQASNHVRWCLNRAKEQVEQSVKEGKGPKHRGLIEVKPNIEEAKIHLQKAEYNLKVMQVMRDNNFSDWSINVGFYSIYHCFLAILSKYGFESHNQTCTVAVVEALKEEGKVKIDDKFIKLLKYRTERAEDLSIIELREENTYGLKVSVNNLNEIVEICKAVINSTKEETYS